MIRSFLIEMIMGISPIFVGHFFWILHIILDTKPLSIYKWFYHDDHTYTDDTSIIFYVLM